jgi:hypothetical protein
MFTVSYPLCEESKRKFVFSYTCRKHEIKEEGGHAKVMKQVCGRPGSSSMPSRWIGEARLRKRRGRQLTPHF